MSERQQSVNAVTELPEPDSYAQEISNRLLKMILEEIDNHAGSISFARYMEMALYEPGLGYYTAGSRKFGEEGDFVTAPEISPLFAQCLAWQCQQILENVKGGDIFEFGAGSGVLAVELMLELEKLSCLPERYLIMEISPELRERQYEILQARVPHLLDRVHWLDKMPDSYLQEKGFQGVVIANEVLDAMPVHRFCVEREASSINVQTLHVKRSSEKNASVFDWCYVPAEAAIVERVEKIQQNCNIEFPDRYESELQLTYAPWLQSLSEIMTQGAILLIDYGYPCREYYLQERNNGTLMCHYRHRAHSDPFILTGLQDITAYVDFTAVAEAALEAGFEVAGFNTQAHFLMGCGLDEIMATMDPENTKSYLKISQQVKTLTLPGEMGERFKVMALKRELDIELRGFGFQDHRDRLL